MSEMTDSECLHEQILQIREVIASIENQTNGVPSIQPEELWSTLNSKNYEDKPMHPRLQQMLQGHVDVEQVKQGLKRLENDMEDLELSEREMYDPFKHELDGGKEETWEAQQIEEDTTENIEETSAEVREKEQRPLSAYGVTESKD
jgi:aspartate oxidase